MADNKIYIAAGTIPQDIGESESSNQVFIAAGLIPTDKVTGAIMNQFMGVNIGADLYNGILQ